MIGSVSAIDSNVTIDDSNLLNENNKIVFSLQNLEVSSDDSIPETPSHDDNYSSDEEAPILAAFTRMPGPIVVATTHERM